MQLDAFPETRCPRELALLQRGQYRALERAYRTGAETALNNFGPDFPDHERERLHRKFTEKANEYAAMAMDQELPF